MIFHAKVPTEDAEETHLGELLAAQATCRCAQDRLLARLRIGEGGVYSVSAALGRNSLSPHGHVSFNCDPARQNSLAEAVMQELRLLCEAGPSEEEASAVRQALADTHSKNLASSSSNSYWLFYLCEAYKGEMLRLAKAGQMS